MTYHYRDHSLSSFDTYLMARDYLKDPAKVEFSKENFRALCNTLVTYISLYYKAARESIADDKSVGYATQESLNILLADGTFELLGCSKDKYGNLQDHYAISDSNLSYFASLVSTQIKIHKACSSEFSVIVPINIDQFQYTHRLCHELDPADQELLCKANPITPKLPAKPYHPE